MNRASLNYLIDLVLAITFLLTALTGLVMKFGIQISFMSRKTIFALHDQAGLVMILFALVHLVLHWKFFVTMSKNLLVKK